MSVRLVYLMRGFPSAGKSHTARKLAGGSGVVLETDLYFHTEVGEDPAKYDYREELLHDARDWNFGRFEQAIAEGTSPIVVDRGNGLNLETQRYAKYAVDHGYDVALKEPDSDWWQEIRVLLKYKKQNRDILCNWGDRLAELSRPKHRVPVETIRHWMDRWRWDLTVEDILNYEGSK